MKHKLLSTLATILTLSLTLGTIYDVAYAEPTNELPSNEYIVEELFEELSETGTSRKKEAELNERLNHYGYEEIEADEVPGYNAITERYASSAVSKTTTTTTSRNVTWYKSSSTITYKGTKYIVETYRAVPRNEKSNLACSGKISKDAKSTYAAKILNFLSVGAKFAISTKKEPGLVMSAYDALTEANQTVTKTTKLKKTSTYYSYDLQTNVIFKFVKKKGSAKKTKLSLVANKTTGQISSSSSTYKYTKTSYKKVDFNNKKSIGTWKESYSNTDAIKYFLGKSTRLQYVCNKITVKGLKDQTVFNYSPLAPTNTAQVY